MMLRFSKFGKDFRLSWWELHGKGKISFSCQKIPSFQRILTYCHGLNESSPPPSPALKIIYWAIMANFLGMNSDYGWLLGIVCDYGWLLGGCGWLLGGCGWLLGGCGWLLGGCGWLLGGCGWLLGGCGWLLGGYGWLLGGYGWLLVITGWLRVIPVFSTNGL